MENLELGTELKKLMEDVQSEAYEHVMYIISNYQNKDGNKYNGIELNVNDFVTEQFSKYNFENGNEKNNVINAVIDNVMDMIKEDELEDLKEIKTELEEELLNKEMKLLELDNIVCGIMHTRSIYEHDIVDGFQEGAFSYYYSDNHDLVVQFDVITYEDDIDASIIQIYKIWIN